MLTEQTHRTVAVDVHQVHERVRILRETRREDDNLVVLRHYLQEVVDAGPFLNEDVAGCTLDLYRDDKVWVAYLVELTMNQSLIEVEHQGLPTFEFLRLRAQESVTHHFHFLTVATGCTALRLRSVLRRVLRIDLWHGIDLALGHLGYHGFQLLLYVYNTELVAF